MGNICALILVAGKGTRMMTAEDQRAKTLRPLLNQPMLYHVLDKIEFIEEKAKAFVLGYQAKEVKEAIEDYYLRSYKVEDALTFVSSFLSSDVSYILQEEQLGTGHAVKMAKDWLKEQTDKGMTEVLIGFGDTPTISQTTYTALVEEHQKSNSACTILTCDLEDPAAFGRILRDEQGQFLAIKEAKDCTEQERAIQEINTGLAVYKIEDLLLTLEELSPQNAQGEYYLTEVPALLHQQGKKISAHKTPHSLEGRGVNTFEELEEVERLMRA